MPTNIAVCLLLVGCATAPKPNCAARLASDVGGVVAAAKTDALCRRQIAAPFKQLVFRAHREKSATAESLYRAYRELFPRARDVTFFYAEWLFGAGRFCDAAPLYDVGVAPDSVERTRAAVIAWEKCDEKDPAYLRAMETFFAAAPPSPDRIAVAYRIGRKYLEDKRYADAWPLFRAVADDGGELAPYAAVLGVEALVGLDDISAIADHATRWSALPWANQDTSVAEQLTTVRVAARRRLIEKLEAAGQFHDAADAYATLLVAEPTAPRRDELAFNRVILLRKAGDYIAADAAQNRFLADYPTSPLRERLVP